MVDPVAQDGARGRKIGTRVDADRRRPGPGAGETTVTSASKAR